MNLTTFDFNETPVRVVVIESEPWWVAADVCRALEISNTTDALKNLDGDDLANSEVIDSLGRAQTANVINESGLYSLIFASRKERAREFKRWVTKEVLPSIRRTGGYALAGPVVSVEAMECNVDSAWLQHARAFEAILGGRIAPAVAQALAQMVTEGRKLLEMRLREETALQVDDGQLAGARALLQMAARTLEADGSFTLAQLVMLAREGGLCREAVSGEDRTAFSALGRRLQGALGELSRDGRGRIFSATKVRTNTGARYQIVFERSVA